MKIMLIGVTMLSVGLVALSAAANPGLHCILSSQSNSETDCDVNSSYNFSPGGAGVCGINGLSNGFYPRGGGLQSWGFIGQCYRSGVSYTEAVCCNAQDGPVRQHFTTSSGTVSCGEGQIAVGGGAICDDSTAGLRNSLPLPYATGSTPTQWTAQCNKGGIWVYVNCGFAPSYSDAVVIRQVEPSKAYAQAYCPSGRIAVSSGFWCGSGYGEGTALTTYLTSAISYCSSNDTHAFAVCAGGQYF